MESNKEKVIKALQTVKMLSENPNSTKAPLFGEIPSISELLESMPRNILLGKDSYGIWQVTNEGNNILFYEMRNNESLHDFLIRIVKAEKIKDSIKYRESFLERHKMESKEVKSWQQRIKELKTELDPLTKS